MDRQKPAHVIRFGRIKAAIWANESANGTWYSVQVCRVYKDGDEWKQTDSFGRDDLPLVCKALDHAHTWIFQQVSSGRSVAQINGSLGTSLPEEDQSSSA